jgi:3-deoxy-D-manno-octulosonate 8-phosphate phosphatase KdsC-like HAD superfamily phosphatase
MKKPKAWIVDVDGTLADVSGIRHFVVKTPDNRFKDFDKFHAHSVDVPAHADVVTMVQAAKAAGFDILIVTARRAKWRHHTAWFLALNEVPSDALFMRGNKDGRRDFEVKADILAQIKKSWDVVHAVDDNPNVIALWEQEGIPVTVIPGWENLT